MDQEVEGSEAPPPCPTGPKGALKAAQGSQERSIKSSELHEPPLSYSFFRFQISVTFCYTLYLSTMIAQRTISSFKKGTIISEKNIRVE